jgi:hypothetical protein
MPQTEDIVVLKWSDLLHISCNKQLHNFMGILHTIRLVVLIISVSWEVSLMVVVLIIKLNC